MAALFSAVILLREAALKSSRGHFQPIFLRRMPKPPMVVLSTIAVLCGSQNNSMSERVEVGFLCSEPCFRDHLFKFCLDENLFTTLILSPAGFEVKLALFPILQESCISEAPIVP